MIARVDARGQSKPIAANITQICIVVAPKPKLSWILLDSYLTMATLLALKATIVLNKVDLASATLCKELEHIYAPLDYNILLTGLHHPENDHTLKQQLDHQISIFVGQSGVGKSSIIRRILPHEHTIQSGALSEHTQLGQHTTSFTRLYHLPSGGALIDSPGIREFSLANLNTHEIAQGFIEFKPWIEQCKFRNCNHQNTPGCAIFEAVMQGTISRQRYENYVRLSQQFVK